MSAPINNTIPNDSNTTVHTEGITNPNVTAPTDHYGIAQKPVPERADAQQAATGPGGGSVAGDAVPFKEQAHGYAKKFHGLFTGNKEEKAFGEQEIKGQTTEQLQQNQAPQVGQEGLQPVGSDHVVPASARVENATPSA